MYKLAIVALIIIVLSSGCSATRKVSLEGQKLHNTDSLVLKVLEKNVSNTGFFIEKGKIHAETPEGKITLFFNLKYKTESVYLISLRSIAGMEAFRVFANKDTVLINDRLNKRLMVGNPGDFEKITGLPNELLNIITGDFFPGRNIGQDEIPLNGDQALYNGFLRGIVLNYTVDCEKSKISELSVNSSIPGSGLQMKFNRHRNYDKNVPREISVTDNSRKMKLVIEIEKITYPWYGDITFTPGAGYEIKSLR